MLGDPAVGRYLTGGALSREESWRKMLAAAGLWTFLGYGYWVVEERESGVFLGQVGFADFKRDLQPSIEGVPEIGWMLATAAQGQGYAFEAASAVLAWADARLDAKRTVAIIAPDNQRSIALAGRLGFSAFGESPYREDRVILFERSRQLPAAAATSAAPAA